MPAYVISERMVEHDNPEALASYQGVAGKLLADHGGVYLTVSRGNKMLNGENLPLVATIIQFPSMAHIEAWWNSTEYRKIASAWANTPTRTYAVEATIPAHAVTAPAANNKRAG